VFPGGAQFVVAGDAGRALDETPITVIQHWNPDNYR